MNKFPWNCGECPMLHTYDLSIDDLTHICLWSKSQIDDCDRYKSAECPMEKHDEEIRAEERANIVSMVEEISHFSSYCMADMCDREDKNCEKCALEYVIKRIKGAEE